MILRFLNVFSDALRQLFADLRDPRRRPAAWSLLLLLLLVAALLAVIGGLIWALVAVAELALG